MMKASDTAILSQLQPFNETRFDACMAFMATEHARSLTQYEMVKLHVMTDLLHTVAHGQPVIGGKLEAWQNGPVVRPAYNRLKHWGYRFDEHGAQPELFDVSRKSDRIHAFKPSVAPDRDDFSAAEVDAMNKAWAIVIGDRLDWEQSQDFFHNPASPVGRVWSESRRQNTPIDWRDLIRAWGEHEGKDLSNVIRLIEI